MAFVLEQVLKKPYTQNLGKSYNCKSVKPTCPTRLAFQVNRLVSMVQQSTTDSYTISEKAKYLLFHWKDKFTNWKGDYLFILKVCCVIWPYSHIQGMRKNFGRKPRHTPAAVSEAGGSRRCFPVWGQDGKRWGLWSEANAIHSTA